MTKPLSAIAPITSIGTAARVLDSMVHSQEDLYLDLATTNKFDLVSDSTVLTYFVPGRTKIPSSSFCKAKTIKMVNGDNKFFGACIFNDKPMSIDTIPQEKKIDIFGLNVWDRFIGGNSVACFPFPEAFDSTELPSLPSTGKRLFPIERGHLTILWGVGTYLPIFAEISEHLKEYPSVDIIKGCPYKDPSTCKYKDKTDQCAFVNEDNVCTKIVGMSATVDFSPIANFGK